MDWHAFWENKAITSDNDFQATGRGTMDVPGYLYTVAEIVRILDLHKGEKLADIGCGAGLISLSLAPWLNHIEALDISEVLVERARENLKGMINVNVQLGSITNVPLNDECFDKVLTYSVLQYLGDEETVFQAFTQVARILKPGGRALLAANPDPTRRNTYEKFIRKNSSPSKADKDIELLNDLLWLSEEKLIKSAKDAGLVARVEPISTHIWQHFYMFDLILEKVK